WFDVHHGVVTIAQHLGQGRLGPVGITGQLMGECSAHAGGALPCVPWRRVHSASRVSLRRRESPRGPLRPELWASGSASTRMARGTESFALLWRWASCNQRARRSALRCSVALELAGERPPERTGAPWAGAEYSSSR